MVFTAFHPHSLPISLPHPFKLDSVKIPFSICIEEKVEKCKKLIEVKPEESVLCVTDSFIHCTENAKPDHMFLKAAMAGSGCVQKYRNMIFGLRDCFLQFYEEHIKTNDCHSYMAPMIS